jgi:hypothetical protein
MAEGNGPVMPPASPGSSRRPLTTVIVVGLAAVLGAGLVVALWGRSRDPAPKPGPAGSASATPALTAGSVTACTGGGDPTAAVVAATRTPATLDGAAETAAAVVRFTESKQFAEPAAVDTIKQIADVLGSGELVALQHGQAPFIAQMTATRARPARGAFAVTPDSVTPTVTVLVPVEWSTATVKHYDWRFIDVRLVRNGERWAVVSADTTVQVAEALKPLRGAEVQSGDLDRDAAALTINGFRRYANGEDC